MFFDNIKFILGIINYLHEAYRTPYFISRLILQLQ